MPGMTARKRLFAVKVCSFLSSRVNIGSHVGIVVLGNTW